MQGLFSFSLHTEPFIQSIITKKRYKRNIKRKCSFNFNHNEIDGNVSLPVLNFSSLRLRRKLFQNQRAHTSAINEGEI